MADSRDDSLNNPAGTNEHARSKDAQFIAEADIHESEREALRKAREAEIADFDASGGEAGYGNLHFGEQKTNEELSADPTAREANEFVTPTNGSAKDASPASPDIPTQSGENISASGNTPTDNETLTGPASGSKNADGPRSENVEVPTSSTATEPFAEQVQESTEAAAADTSAAKGQFGAGPLRGPAYPESEEQQVRNPDANSDDSEQPEIGESNSAPSSLSLSDSSVDENDAGALVATLSSVDPDVDDTATYTLAHDPSGLFEVVGDELRLKEGAFLDHETQDSYEITLIVTDSEGAFYEQTVTINVADVNEGPTSLTLSGTNVDENNAGAVVAALSSSDVDDGDTATYALSDDASGLFEVVGNELKLKDGVALDHESQDAYAVTLTVTDAAGASFEQTVTIDVTDINDEPTSLTLSDTSVDENAAGVTVATLSSVDVDEGDSATYALADDSSGLFEVVGNELKLKDGVALNHEGQDSYELTLTVTDSAGAAFEQTVTINVADINEGPSQISLSSNNVDENDTGAIVGSLTTTDVDDGDTHSYQVSDERFEVVDGNLKLKDGISFDHETAETIDVTVTATDLGGLSTSQEFSINVADINEVPTTVDFISTRQVNIENAGFENRNLGEHRWGRDAEGWESTGSSGDWNPTTRHFESEAPEGENVAYVNSGTLSQSLSETFSDSGFYTLSVDVGNREDVGGHGDYEIRLFAGDVLIGSADAGAPAEGEWQTVSFDVSASDFPDDFAGFGENLRIELAKESGGQVNFDNVQLTVTDPGADMNVPENHPGAQIAILSTIDPDEGDSHSYTVSDDRFEVVDGALKLKDGVSLNHEEAASVDLVITATDNNGLSVDQDFTVQVGNVNEAPTGLALTANTVGENVEGATIGALSVNDSDMGDGHAFAVSDDRFEIVDGNLKLKDGVSLNHEQAETVDVTVVATDNGGLSTEQTFSISVGDENEAPTDINFNTTRDVQIENAGFENRDLADARWGRGADGWESTGSSGDWNPAQRSLAAEASEGDNVAYLNSGTLSQTTGEEFSSSTVYELSVDVGNRQDVGGFGDYEIRLYAGDELIGTADGGAPAEGGWETVSLQVNGADFPDGFAGYGENIRIELVKESGGQVNFDNVRMTASEQTEPLSVNENEAGGSIGPINVVDEDQGDSHIFTVSDDRFEVVDGALKLKDGVTLDHETADTIDVTITATDSGGLATSEEFSINVADVNEAPVSLTLSSSSVAENDTGATVATLSSTDMDDGDSAIYALSEDSSGLFEVVGNELKLKDGVSLDHEAQNSYEVTLSVTDNAGESFEQTVTIDVADVNEGPTSLSLSDTSVNENDSGATVATLSSTDPDDGDSATYALSEDSSGLFEVVGNELKLKDGVSLDHEGQDSYEVTLSVTDNAGESFEQTVTIDVADVNDAPTAIELSSNTIGESVESGGNIGSAVNQSGVVVGDLSITDQDGDAASQYQLTDIDGNPIDHPQFEIVGNQVVVKSGAELDYESTPTVDVYITATDSGGASTTQSFTLELTDSEGSFVGDAGNNVARGTSEEDNIAGGEGNDYLAGNDGNDTISGDAGNDRIIGGDGADELHGGAGNDLIYADSDDTAVTGGEGTDRVIVQGDGDFTIDQTASGVERVDGGAGNDQMDATGMTDRATQLGNAGDDTLTGGEGNDVQYGGADNDVISGGGGNDVQRGDDGNDVIDGGAGNDVQRGGDGDDTISGGDGNDNIQGNAGADELHGGAGNDLIYADSEDTAVTGGEGTDRVIVQGDGDFTIDQNASSVERVDGGAGNDQMDATGMTDRATQLGNGGDDTLTGGDGSDVQYGGADNDVISGGGGNDVQRGDDGNDVIDGGAGNDVQRGGDGNDTISGGDGNDNIQGNAGADELHGGAGNDLIYADGDDTAVTGGEGTDRVIVQGDGDFTIDQTASSVERVDGGAGNDQMDATGMTERVTQLGNGGDDTITGGSGNDVQRGGDGNDVVHGGDGNDNIQGNAGADELHGGAGNDLIYADSEDTAVTGGEGTDRVIVQGDGDFTIDQNASSVERVDGGTGNDQLDATGMTDRATQLGNAGDDTLTGGSGNDVQRGGDGNDVVYGGDGNDNIQGNAGADELHGGAGNDLIYADSEDTAVTGGEGTDRVIVQGDGDFTIDQTASSVERVDGGAGNDQMDATGMTDRATQLGNAGDDTLTGGDGSDVQRGGADNDVISGGDGNDVQRGDDGDDRITGGAGNDYIDGGAGDDTAVFSGNRADYTVTQLGENSFRITDDRPGAPDGSDRVLNVENFEFADGTVPVEHILNEAPDSLSVSNSNVDENDAGATIATLSSTDADVGDSATYALSDDASGLFEVVGNELKLKDGASLDHEGQDSHEVTLSVTDSAGASFEQTVTINVNDVNEGPTSLTLSDTNVDENDAGATVATLSSTDVDDGDSATYALSDDASGLFEVVGNELKLKDGASLDHEGQDSYEVSLTVTDGSGASFEQTVTIDVNDVNEGPTSLTLSDTNVDENDAGATVATLSSTDVDEGDSATYALSDDASGLFEVVGNELKLKDGASLDHEAQDSHDVTLTVTDGSGASFEQTVTINVSDVDEPTVVGDVDLGQTSEDTSVVITKAQLLAQSNDPEGATLNVTDASVDPAYGSLADNGDGSWTFTPTQDLAVDDVPISFDVSDGSSVQSAVASIDVAAVADAPILTLGSVTQEELGESNTVNSGFEVEGIDVSGSSSDWIDSLGDWETTSDAIEVKQETLADGSTNQFIELNDDAVDYYDDATNIVRTIETEDGATYTVSFENAARPGYDGSINEIEVVINGEVVDTFSADGTGSSAINWESNSVTFVGDGTDATVEFRASGEAQSYGRGMYLDDVVITEELPVGHAAGDGQIALPEISVAATDTDGSETVTTVISDIPDGFIISDGTNTFTAEGGTDSVDISDWALDQMTVTPSDGFTGEVSLNVTATSTDGSDQTETTEAITLNVEPSDDVLTGSAGEDTIAGGGGDDTISGQGGDDVLSGGSGEDIINGDGGNDTIDGGTGDDVLNGGDGSDVFVYAQGDGSDVVDGGAGGGWTDAIQIEGGISSLGNFGTDWTIELTEGSVTAQDSESITFSEDAAGSLTFSDGSTVEFENLEQII